jgi:hypothetical protein
VYAHLVLDQERGQIALQYWLYFYFNDWNNKHESDWEFVQLTFDARSADEALTSEPASVVYAQHGGGETAKWTDDKVRKEDGHPVIYTPKGSHGSLYGSDLALGKGEAGTGFGCDDATPPSQRFLPRVLVVPDTVTGPEDPFAWITYEGRWGEKVSGEFNGPTGPNTKRPWTDPLGWQEEQRDESVVVPEDAIGPNAAKAFCGVVAGGSKLLLQTGPYIVVVLLVGFVGATAVTARRTQFRPVDVEPLRQRRRFGQIVGCSLGVLTSNASLFLSIGALFVPIGIAVTAVQGFVVDHSPAEPVLDLVDEVAADGVVALALGGLGFGITYWLVLVGVIGALRDMDSGTSVSAMSAFRRVWKQKWALLTARLRALAIIVLLSATIIGIPVAIWLAVRWTFLEHAILFEETSGKGARGVSARLVAGSWLRTLGFTIVVGYGAVALGPIVGMAVLLLTPAPLSIVNLISSMIYVTLVPCAAIAFTILYFDLKLAQSAAPTVFAPPSRAGARTNARREP